ncbi:hypothetical protein ONE63_010884 [Megalurothrips usitatus]|uniref:TFIIS N-terminal domain-containing protein n=1 Tax=Megalurothrips usitatus TaxID=439358 RepID=A0AAV7XFE0_9NEOP|nr:hypothetical protein ONE63_010884 [Megalurothrips usitatus]
MVTLACVLPSLSFFILLQPRIDPHQLLKCLSVLLGPSGGILSRDQVSRLASLMVKFSRKLVSKCIYVLILKNTKTELINLFMSEGGWALTNSWLADAIEVRNWPLMKELLELLLMCPVDVERLKLNNCPKLVKGLSRDTTDKDVQCLATRLVAQWLQVVKTPGSVLPHPTLDPSHLPLDQHSSLDMVPQAQIQMLEEPREDGHFNFFPTDSSMQIDIHSELFCDPSDITFDTISKDDLLPASDSLCEFRGDGSALINSGVILGDVSNEIASEVERLSEFSDTKVSDVNCGSTVQLVSDVNTEIVNEQTELMDTSSAVVVTNGEPQDKIVLRLNLKDAKKVKSPTKRKLSEDEEDVSPSKRKPRDISKDKKKEDRHDKEKSEKDKSDKSASKHDKSDRTDKKSSDKKSSSKDSRESHKSESRHSESRSRHHHSDKSKDRSRDKDKDRSKSLSSKDREKEREKSRLKEKEKLKLKEKEKAETQAEKDKATLAKVMQASSVSKLGKIPKKTDSSKSGDKVHPPVLVESKKPSISIENRKQAGEPRPKTVKTPPTKFRSTGLEEVVKPPPSRKDVKKPVSSTGLPLPNTKDSSPLLSVPALSSDKRSKPVLNLGGPPDRPGGIKVIPAKPKSAGLQDSDFFMDALNAANTKREPRKRKRRTSGSKDEPTSPTASSATPQSSGAADGSGSPADPAAPASPASSPERPVVDAKPVFKFYQETLQLNDDDAGKEDEEDKTKVKKEEDEENAEEEERKGAAEEGEASDAVRMKAESVESNPEQEPDPAEEENNALMEREKNRLPRGVLVFHRPSQRQRKSLKWKVDSELESVHYFELDETERVNVTKTSFLDMKQMERVHERENFHMTRRMNGEDQMKEQILWTGLVPIDLPPSDVVPGFKSMEKEIQFARAKSTPASPVFLKNLGCPDTPAEPDFVSFVPKDPERIPLEDKTGANSVNDFTNTPWPEPKPLLIPQSPPHSHTMPHPHPGPHPGPLLQTPLLGAGPSPTGYHTVGGDWRVGTLGLWAL